MSFITRVKEKILLFFRMIFVNKKYTLVAFLGLGLSLSLIGTSLIYLYSFQFNAFNTYISENPQEQITVSPTNMLNSFGIEETIIPDLNALVDDALSSNDLGSRVTNRMWINRRAVVVPFKDYNANNATELFATSLVGAPSVYFNILEKYLLPGGVMPSKINETIALIRSDRLENSNLSMGIQNTYVVYNLFNLWSGVFLGIPQAGAPLNVTGLINIYDIQSDVNISSENRDLLNNLFSVLDSDELFLTYPQNLMRFTSGLTGPPSLVVPNEQSYIASILFKLDEIDAFKLDTEISNLISFTEQIRSSIETTDYTDEVHIDMDLLLILQSFSSEFTIFRIFTLLFMIPIISMALSLTAYSSNLVKKRRKRQLSLLGQRGASRTEIITMLLLELVIFTIIAVIMSFLIAYPYSFLILKSDGFLSFGGATIIPQVYVFIIEIILIAGFAGSLLVNIGNIINMSDLSQEEAFSEKSDTKPFWERFYIDVFFLVIGITFWVITSIQLRNANVSIAFAQILGAPAPIIVIIGTILFVSRLYPLLTNWLSKVTWKIHKLELVSLSLKSLSRRRSATMRSLILIMLTFTMAITSIIIPDTYIDFDYENASYDIGADIVISGVSILDTDFRTAIEEIEGVTGSTYVNRLSYSPLSRGSVTYYNSIFGINTTEYADVGYFEKEYLPGNIEKILEALDTPLKPGVAANVLVNPLQTEAYDVGINDTFNIYYPYWSGGQPRERNFTVNVVGFYNYWPTLYNNVPDPTSTNFRLGLITSITNIYSLTLDSTDVYTQLFIDVADNYIVEDVVDDINQLTFGRRIKDVDSEVTISRGSLRASVIYGALNSNFIASAVILIMAMTMMTVIHSLERTSEIGIMKTVGISPKQLFGYYFTESFSTILVGSITGILLGLFTSYMFMSIIAVNSFIPPWEMTYSPLKLIGTIFLMLLVSLVSSAIPGIIFSTRKEAEIIREI